MNSSSRLDVDNPDLTDAERSLRLGWHAAVRRTDGSRPTIGSDYVARQGRAFRVLDVRDAADLLGPLGHVPGCSWLPLIEAGALHERVGPFEPLVLVCEDGTQSLALAAWLEQAGLRLVAALEGGMKAWRRAGLATARDATLPERKGQLAAFVPWASETDRAEFTLEEITEHVGRPQSVRWLKLAAFLLDGRMACVDGRDSTAVVGSPGGDAGELVLALGALEDLLGEPLSDATIGPLIERRVDAFGRFAFHTDVAAGNRMIAAIRADARTAPAVAGLSDYLAFRAFFSSPPPQYREALAEIMVRPEHLGCGHLRLATQHAARWGIRDGLTQQVLKAAMQLRWQGVDELEVTPLPGGHGEGAVVNIHLGQPIDAFSFVPLVAPAIGGRQMFVNHPQVSSYLRDQLARWLCQQEDLFPPPDAKVLYQAMQALHATQLGETLGALAAGLPIFDVVVHRDGRAEVTCAGRVPGERTPH